MRWIVLLALFFLSVWGEGGREKVSLLLNWKFQFESAGFVAAKEKGFYREAGLDVDLLEYHEGMDVVTDVLGGKATYGLYNSSIVVKNGRIEPIVLMATYLQRSPLVFAARKGIKTPADFIGKTIMGTTYEFRYSTLGLMLDHYGVSNRNARFVDHTFNIEDFVEGKVDIMTVFRSNELFYLDKRNIPYEIIDPAEYGFLMSAENLFTSMHEALEHPERTQAFIDATNRGWKYALDHPDEIIELLLRKYHVQKSKEALRYEAKATRELMMTDFFPIGATNPELTVLAYKQFLQSGALEPDQKLGKFIFSDIINNTKKALSLTSEEKAYLLQKKKIRMCVDPEWYPFEVIRNGRHQGIAADVMHVFSHEISTPIEYIPTHSWAESVELAKKRECDIFSLASSTPSRISYMDFTSPYVTLPVVMVTQSDEPFIDDIASLEGKKLAVVRGYAIAEKLRMQYPQLDIVDVDSIDEGLKKVEKGEYYGYIDNLMVVSSYIQKKYTGLLKVSLRLNDKVELAVGTRNDEPILHDIFEKLVLNLDEKTMQQIYNRWASTVEEVAWINTPQFWKTVFIISLIVLAFLWHYYQLRRYNKKLLELSVTDKLTGLFNRQKIDEELLKEQQRLERYNDYRYSVMMIDIDHFKMINDLYGHQRGDHVLQVLAHVFRQHLRSTDLIGRWGGEEFLVILPHTDTQQAFEVAEHLRAAIKEMTFGFDEPVTISIGVGVCHPSESVHHCISRVDSALYQAKNNGRNRTCEATLPF